MTINKSVDKVVDFSGKNIYIGIDDHLNQWNVSIYLENSFHKVFQQAADAGQLRAYLERYFPGGIYYSACEVGFKGFVTHRALAKVGVKNIVVNAADVPTKDRERKQKRDALDARKLGKLLRGGLLDGIYVPPAEVEADRALLRYRNDDLVPKQTRIKNQIKSYLYRYGQTIPEAFKGKKWNNGFKKWLREVDLGGQTPRMTLDHRLDELAFHEAKLKQVNEQIKALSEQERYRDRVKLLCSIPGVGLLNAMLILTELVDMKRFVNIDHLCSYIGLIPNTYSSDEQEHIGQMTHRGHQLFRRMWIQAAWRARSLDPALLNKYEEWLKRMKPQEAIVRIAKKLLVRMRYVLQSGNPYELGKI